MPDAWSNGAPLTFQLSIDGLNYHDLHHVDPSTYFPYEVNVARPPVGGVLTLPTGLGAAVSFVKIRSGTAALRVTQQADRLFQLVLEIPNTVAASAAAA
jgi:hypothetical protein